jgi:3-oxoacyl-[acyl-carrier protein] reductase
LRPASPLGSPRTAGISRCPPVTPNDQRVGHGEEPDDPERLADELRGQNRRIVLVPGDLEDPAVPAEVVNSSAEHLGGLDALVMSHAESVDSGIHDTTVESFDRH